MRDSRRTRVVLAVLLLTAFTFITLDARGGDDSLLDKARSATQSVFGPIERAAAAVVRPVSDFVDGLTSINSNQQRIDELEAENDALNRELQSSEYDQGRVDEFEKVLRVAGLGRYKILPAQVIAVSAERGYAQTVLIDAGTRDNISKDQTVLNGDGLVGRVIEVGTSTATVLLVEDPKFAVGARLVGPNELGFVQGHGVDPPTVTLWNGQAKIVKGGRLVTSGSPDGKPFVPGVPIGTIRTIEATPGALTRTGTISPFVNFSSLDLVGVVVEPPLKNPRDAVLPPVPTDDASPTPSPPLVGSSPSESSTSP